MRKNVLLLIIEKLLNVCACATLPQSESEEDPGCMLPVSVCLNQTEGNRIAELTVTCAGAKQPPNKQPHG